MVVYELHIVVKSMIYLLCIIFLWFFSWGGGGGVGGVDYYMEDLFIYPRL